MARKILGYTQLEWTCPRCGARNPGPEQTCQSCGGPQPENVAFEQPLKQELITGEQAETIAAQQPDIHCGFCGTRNSAQAAVCLQCGADLQQGSRRASGAVVGSFSTAAVAEAACPACSSLNPADARFCRTCGAPLSKPTPAAIPAPVAAPPRPRTGMIIAGVAVLLLAVLCLLAISGVFNRTTEQTGTVESVSWRTQLAVEALSPVQRSAWRDQIPTGAELGACEYRFAFTADEPQPVATEVCGTPYTVDQGTGFGEVVQDCVYQVYAEHCSYTVLDWQVVDTLNLQGSDLNPSFQQPQLSGDQRVGGQQAVYQIVFRSGEENYTYETSDLSLFQQAQPGSRWMLNINSRGRVVSIEPFCLFADCPAAP
ncbi:MAG: zinc ribbon domain-containing protein [Chloroflexota bacterium]